MLTQNSSSIPLSPILHLNPQTNADEENKFKIEHVLLLVSQANISSLFDLFTEMIVDIARYFHSQATRTKKKVYCNYVFDIKEEWIGNLYEI